MKKELRGILAGLTAVLLVCHPENSLVGYAMAAEAKQTANEPVEGSEISDVIPMNCLMEILDEANLRNGPGTEYESLGKAEIGKKCMVTGKTKEEEWYQVVYDGQCVYISAQYLGIYENDAEEAVDEELEKSARQAEAAAAEELKKQEEDSLPQETFHADEEKTEVSYDLAWVIGLVAFFVCGLLGLIRADNGAEKLRSKEAAAEEEESPERQDRTWQENQLEIIDLEEEEQNT